MKHFKVVLMVSLHVISVACINAALKEVNIISPEIEQKGDTISYLVASFMDENDRTIGDIMKKLPGIEVQENGQIFYQNTLISKFCIEESDLLQGRYDIATQNMEARDVYSIEVLENNQGIKVNLKLKKSAKGAFISNALLGAGLSPVLWSGEIAAMYFTQDKQNIITYKGNNTGNDVCAEQRMLYSQKSDEKPDEGLLSVQSPSSPSISRKRYLFNQANAFSFNSLWKVSPDYQINANINYVNDRIDKSSIARTDYYLLRGFTVEETLNSRSYVNRADADIQLNVNKNKFSMNNTLKLEGGWNSERGELKEMDIRQQLEKPDYDISNSFKLVKNYKKIVLQVSSYNRYFSIPHSLTVQPASLYEMLFESAADFQAMRQKSTTNRFVSNTAVSVRTGKGNLRQRYTLNFRADLRRLDSELSLEQQNTAPSTSMKLASDSLRNSLLWNKFEWIFTPSYTYNIHNWKFSLNLPVNFTNVFISNRLTQRDENNPRLFFSPSLEILCKLSAYWNFKSTAKFSRGFGGINNEYTGYIMRSYRSLVRNEGDLYETATQKYDLNLYYRNPIRSLFGNFGLTYTGTKANLLYGNSFVGILRVQKSIAHTNYKEGVTAQLNVNQAIDAIASTVKLGGTYTLSTSSQLTQGRIFDVNLQQYTISPGIETRLNSWSGFSYRFNYAESRNIINNDKSILKPIHTTSQNIRINLFPVKNLVVDLSYEYFQNSAIVFGSRTMRFGDIGAKYQWRRMEFLLDYTNVFNSKQYTSISYTNISSYYYAYNLRPAEILLRVRFRLK